MATHDELDDWLAEDELDADVRDRIVVDPLLLAGKPTIKGTRISVSMILSLIGAGFSPEQIVDDYSPLTTQDIRAAILYAAHLLDRPDIEAAEAAHAMLTARA